MRQIGSLIVITLALCAGALPQSAAGPAEGHAERKVIYRVVPAYPEIAKNNRITGAVKIEVVVRADGSVKSTKVLGGSPALMGSASDAVRNWKFEVRPQETIEVVQLTFKP
jgi:periplasmic protein TonB